ncbi:MAG: hypothetical protein ABI972_07945 [Acidobacteriota bacterium]
MNLQENIIGGEVPIDFVVVLSGIEGEDRARDVVVSSETLENDVFTVVRPALEKCPAFTAFRGPTKVGGTDIVGSFAVGTVDAASESAENDFAWYV